jgi:hypothetical protein
MRFYSTKYVLGKWTDAQPVTVLLCLYLTCSYITQKMAGIFVRQLAVLESSPCATGCLFVLLSFSKTGIPRDIKIILGLRTLRTDCGTLALELTQFGKQRFRNILIES